jgi:hypothetical protein
MTDLFKEIIPSILQTKKNVLEDETDYVPFVVNKALSFHFDCIMYANQMNMLPNLPRNLQYQYLINTVRGYKRPYRKWQKREEIENLGAVKEYYNYSNDKAKEALKVLSDADINEIKIRTRKGGLNDKSKRTSGGGT